MKYPIVPRQRPPSSTLNDDELRQHTSGATHVSRVDTVNIPGLANFDSLPDSAHVRIQVVMALYGSSRATIWRGVKAGRIPKPKKLSLRISGFNVGELRSALREV